MISTSLITYNRLKLNRYFIETYNQNIPKEDTELIVVDNHSIDGTVEYLKEQHKLDNIQKLILNDQNYGLGKAANQGFEISDPRTMYVSKFDNDFAINMGYFENLLSVIEVTKAECIIVCKLERMQSFDEHWVREINGVKFQERPREIGGCFFIRNDFRIQHNIRMNEMLFEPGYAGPNAEFFEDTRNHGGRTVRLMSPCITRKYERYSDPEHYEYYKEVFAARGLLHTLPRFINREKAGGTN